VRGHRGLNTANAEAFLIEQHEHRDRLVFLETDVSSEERVESLVQEAVHRFGRLDVMVNNAGVGGAFGPVTDIAVEDWDLTLPSWSAACSWASSMQLG
jgi:NAD(P)-dependent dehydrogenase (short-subunit alcohol dehydrogenase family)